MPSNFVSFSKDFKSQYYARDKSVKNEIDMILDKVKTIVTYIIKTKTPFQKIKMRIKIKSTCESLIILVTPTPKIIVRRLE